MVTVDVGRPAGPVKVMIVSVARILPVTVAVGRPWESVCTMVVVGLQLGSPSPVGVCVATADAGPDVLVFGSMGRAIWVVVVSVVGCPEIVVTMMISASTVRLVLALLTVVSLCGTGTIEGGATLATAVGHCVPSLHISSELVCVARGYIDVLSLYKLALFLQLSQQCDSRKTSAGPSHTVGQYAGSVLIWA